MPGIVGLITTRPRDWAAPQLSRMVQAIRHESFYITGTWVDEALGVYVGWTAIEGSFSDGMPVTNERKSVSLVFSGEEYASPEAVRDLKARGHEFDAHGPSYLAHLYEDDPLYPSTLNGMFHGLMIDRDRRVAILFNDRFGMHRVYYHESKDAFYFASEAKAILAVRHDLRAADPRGLGELVSCGCVLENRTVFKDIFVLPSGSKWIFRNGSLVQKTTYFQPREWEDQAPLEPEAYFGELRDTLSRNLPRYFNGKQQVGVALTGGLDTRVIMACRQAPPQTIPCYTWGGTYRESQDVILARKIAETCKQSYEVVTVGNEFLSRFPRYAERIVYLTDACVDVSRAPDLFVSEKAREIAPVKVVGTYGSELLCHARMFKPVEPSEGLLCPEFSSYVRLARETYTGLLRENPVSFVAFRQSPWYHYGILALEQTQLVVRSPFMDNDFVRTVFRAPKVWAGNGSIRQRLIAEGNPVLGQIRSDRGINGNGFFSGLRRALLEGTFKAEYAYDYGMPQWVAMIDHLFAPLHLERLFLGRHKFAHFRVWYRDRLADYVKQMLLDPQTLSRPYLEPKGVEAMVSGHLKGNQNFTTEIHRALTLELLHRLFLNPC